MPLAAEPVMIWPELATAMTDRRRPDLARSLINLGNALNVLGRDYEAGAGRREAEENQ
jgi:hypothetical protein